MSDPSESDRCSASPGPPPFDPQDPGPQDPGAFALPFQALGHADGHHFFLSDAGTLERLAPASMKGAAMLNLAPLSWWAANFPGKSGPAWMEAADTVVSLSKRAGLYDPCRIRGRGAWEDAGRAVVHQGDRLIVDGEPVPVQGFPSRFIYVRRPAEGADLPAPAPAKQAHRLVELCEMLHWERPVYAKFLAGWCAVAHICGALRWRPHIWITGESGAGKTSVYDNILRAALAGNSLPCQSASTEAGIRQALGSDALPVIFDEAESENQRGRERLRAILELARQASSENGAAILKGTVTGQAQEYRIRSTFAFSSIVVAAEQKADVSRITVLTLRKYYGADAQTRFARIAKTWAELMTPAFAAALRSRCIQLIPKILANSETFAQAVAVHLGSRRYGDQVGTLLAGAYSLHSSHILTPDKAQEWVEAQAWDETQESPEDADEMRMLLRMLQHQIQVEAIQGPAVRREVGEICRTILDGSGSGQPYSTVDGHDALARFGLRISQETDSPELIISSSHAAIRASLENTPWATGWGRLLLRLPGATKVTSCRFAGTITRAVSVPVFSTPLGGEAKPE